MRVGLDMMGGDFAPRNVLEGSVLACSELSEGDKLVLFGNMDIVGREYSVLYKTLMETNKVEFIDAPETIDMCESPTRAFTQKPHSSMAVGFKHLKDDLIDVFLGAGNSGAMLVGAIYSVKVIEGVIRPAIASFLPRGNGKFSIIIDVGINPDARHDVLFQFGFLGSLYLKSIFNIENPRVGLINIGHEREKGNLVTQAAYNMMEGTDKFNFIGNVEGYDLLNDEADVLVCDGFTGNVIIKTIEGLYHILKNRQVKDDYLETFNYEIYGGTPILGINKPVILGHGVSSPLAFSNMIKLGKQFVGSNLLDEIKYQILNQNNYQ